MKKYRLESYGQLLLSRVAVGGRNGVRVVKSLFPMPEIHRISGSILLSMNPVPNHMENEEFILSSYISSS